MNPQREKNNTNHILNNSDILDTVKPYNKTHKKKYIKINLKKKQKNTIYK